ncbi:DMT family transporter [Amycolatopsis sp. PS_44_ISF1]|uniref:DMT family transporter n=1 Tax=Amycolatopsis sp. PS_44_ISF1 TaxID=2974917 RepID=UPI0028DF05ED|nr:DMT family transporter [Amycolatopsis sp. PS_44_ISF1]MDT8912379.1 DMT family transporter [Amycolatopsis sp. PS_44_ISF1]
MATDTRPGTTPDERGRPRTERRSRTWGPATRVLAGAGCLSASAVLVKVAAVDPATSAFLRCAIALVVLAPLAWREYHRSGPLSRRGVVVALIAGVALGADYVMWTRSIFDVGAGIATVLINVQVIVLPLLGLLIDRERTSRRFVLACPVMLAGIVLISGVLEEHGSASNTVRGTVFGVLAGAAYALYLYLTRRQGKAEPGRTTTSLAVSTASAAATSAALSPLSSGIHLGSIGPGSWLAMIGLAVLGQVLAWLLINSGSPLLPANQTAALLLTQPVATVVLSLLVLAEVPSALEVGGMVLVLASVAVANRVWSRPRRG